MPPLAEWLCYSRNFFQAGGEFECAWLRSRAKISRRPTPLAGLARVE